MFSPLRSSERAHTFARAISSSANLHRERPLNRVSSARTYSFFVSYFLLLILFALHFKHMENPKGVSYFIKKELPQLNFALIFLVFCSFLRKILKEYSKHMRDFIVSYTRLKKRILCLRRRTPNPSIAATLACGLLIAAGSSPLAMVHGASSRETYKASDFPSIAHRIQWGKR